MFDYAEQPAAVMVEEITDILDEKIGMFADLFSQSRKQ